MNLVGVEEAKKDLLGYWHRVRRNIHGQAYCLWKNGVTERPMNTRYRATGAATMAIDARIAGCNGTVIVN